MVLNVSDDGMAISMAIPVGDEAYSNLYVRMNGLAQSVEVHGRMAWTTTSKKRAGIQLVDVSDEQCGQIREWLAQEGVRDVNLLPRVLEPAAASVLPTVAAVAISPELLDESSVNSLPLAASAPTNPTVLEQPQASLLAGLGGTAPEFLGPAQDEPARDAPAFTEDTIAETQSSQTSNPNFAGFRENEWDLASITMVPRKKSKPEGLSALALLLLWIAIPSFGIGIIVGRRPLERWLSHGAALRKNISHVAAPEPDLVTARDESPDITGSDIDASGPQSIPRTVESPPPTTNSQDAKTSAATKSFVSTPAVLDNKLLNSMSTQELRAFKSPAPAAAPENANANGSSKLDSKADGNVVNKDASSSSARLVKPVTRPDTLAASTNASTSIGNASAQRRSSKDKSAVARATAHDTQSIAVHNKSRLVQGSSRQNPSDQVARTISVDHGVNAGTTNNRASAPSNVAPSHSSTLSVRSKVVPRTPSNATGTIATAPATENSSTHQNIAGSTPATQAAGNVSTPSTQSVNHSVTPVSGTAMNSAPTSSPVSDTSRNNNTASNTSKTQPESASSTNATAKATTTLSAPAPPRPESRVASDTTPRIASNLRPSMASTSTPGPGANVPPSSYMVPSSRPVAPSGTTDLAPVNAQPALRGVMLVARKNNESFLLKLPVEAVVGGRSVSVQMQRFVMVPAESRWHHHGPIAKLTVGELLTHVAAHQLETASNARPGDAITVRAFLDKNGSVQDLKPLSGRFGLMPRVMREVREWQFDQTLVDGKPVESEVNITVEFHPSPQPTRSREIQAQNSFKP
jgi:hypothetical protein